MTGPQSARQTAVAGTAIVGLGVGATVLAWPSLPAEMAVHWDASGTADGNAPRVVGAFLLPVITLAMLGLLVALPSVDPLGENVEEFREVYNGFVLLMTGFLTGVHAMVLATNLGYDVPISAVTVAATGLLLVYTGLLLRVAEPNWFVGIRTPWTLSSERVWYRVHSVGGISFVLVGAVSVLAAIVGTVVGPAWLGVTVLTAGSLLAAVVLVLYSYYLYGKFDQPADNPVG